MKSNSVFRIRLISGGVLLVVLVFIGKLYSLQIISGNDFRLRAERQYLNPNDTIYDRGSIFFQNKDKSIVAAASIKTGFTLGINPQTLKNPEDAFNKINAIVQADKKTFLAKAEQKNLQYSIVAKKIDEILAKKIIALKIPGVLAYQERYRFYPGNSLAANAVGLVGFKGDVSAGRYGLESFYDTTLSRNNNNPYSNFFVEIFSGLQKAMESKTSLEGDIVTTIEPTVQGFLEKELITTQNTWHSKSSGGIIMNPKTGEIYAMGVYPSFNPNNLANESDPAIFSNPIVENDYEMGSIIKPLTMAAGIDSGTVTATTTYNDKGFLILNGSKISNFDGKGRGVVDMQGVLNQSLNTGAAFVAGKMGNTLFSSYFRQFGLGEKTGIDLPNEVSGLMSNLDSPRDLEHATASFGQGIAMSPIATVRALSAIGNGGYLVTPHLVARIQYKVGVTKTLSYPKGPQVMKPQTSVAVIQMLATVFDEALLNGAVKMARYTMAAKTGTAQIAKPGGGGYYSDKYLHSFFGFFPAYDPQFIIFLYTVEPQGVSADFASHTLTPAYVNIAKFLINYYQVPPDR